MKCPHCLHAIKPNVDEIYITSHKNREWNVHHYVCPNCDEQVILLSTQYYRNNKMFTLVFPKAIQNQPLPIEVDDQIVINDYNESSLVLIDSPKSSAALSRRCIQYILREKLKTKSKDLADQIQEVIDEDLLPVDISEGLDAVRNIGNFAAHVQKSKSTGEILDVEPHEAEWNIEILYDLIEHIYVRPVRFQKKKDDFNIKLEQAGKQKM